MYAKTESELEIAQTEFFGDDSDDNDSDDVDPCDRYRERVRTFLDRGPEWLTLHRQRLLIRRNNTNNYSEATVRILKDVILQRTKAYNVVALVDFCSSVLEDYMVKRLLSFAHCRRADPRLQYTELCRKMQDVSTASATVLNDKHYLVPSQTSRPPVMYTVDADIGLCACASGQTGAFCKHQAFVHERFNVPFPNAPAVGFQDRYMLALIALGDKCSGQQFFRGLHDVRDVDGVNATSVTNEAVNNFSEVSCATVDSADVLTVESIDVASVGTETQLELDRLKSLIDTEVAVALHDLLPSLKNITTKPQIISAIYQLRSSLRAWKGGAIRVQPTSIACRRLGVTRGCKRIAAGRPTISKPAAKRPRCLAANVAKNVANAKSHGIVH